MIQALEQLELRLSPAEASHLKQYEAVIAAGLTTFVEVGTALLAIRDERLYRATHPTFEAYCRERWEMSYRRAHQLIDAAEVVTHINVNNCSHLPTTESQVRPLTGLTPEGQRAAWEEAVQTAPNGKVTAAHVQSVVTEMVAPIVETQPMSANPKLLGYVGRQPGTQERDSNAWYTPSDYIERARATMGGIDLDPFSSDIANKSIRATRIFTATNSAFDHPWIPAHTSSLRVWMNPPYSVAVLPKAVAHFLDYWRGGHIAQALVLVNNCTETLWFKDLREACTAVCFPTSRLAFVSPDGKPVSGATRGQVVLYYGDCAGTARFAQTFRDLGWVIDKNAGWTTHD